MSEAASFRDLELIRGTLNITNRELGLILGQSREIVESWFNGVEPDPLDAPRIAQLGRAVQTLVEAGVPVSIEILRRKMPSGPSILSAIAQGDNLQAVVPRLITPLPRDAAQRERLHRRTAGRRRPTFDPGAFGAPAWAEETGKSARDRGAGPTPLGAITGDPSEMRQTEAACLIYRSCRRQVPAGSTDVASSQRCPWCVKNSTWVCWARLANTDNVADARASSN